MLRAIATVSLSGTLPEKLAAASAARFDGVEIFESDLTYFDGSPQDIRNLAADLGLSIDLFQPFREFEGSPAARRQRNLDRAERKFDLMAELGAPLMLVCSNVADDTILDDQAAIDDLGRLAELAGKRGIRVGYEALAWGRHVRTWGHSWRIVNAVNHSSLGLIVDSFHTLSLGDDPSGLASVPGDRIFFVQIADAPKLSMDLLSWSRHFRCFPGQGEFDVAAFLDPVVASGYRGPISLEVFNDDLRAAPARQSAIDGMRSLLHLEEETGRRLTAAPARPEPRDSGAAAVPRHADLFSPPAPSPCAGVEFIEFAVDDRAASRLAAWLGLLGFVKAGRHVSKNVTLYRQGSVNLILNAENDSFAQSYFLVHGPSVCAIAIRLDDAGNAFDRAKLFRCQPFEGRIGSQELRIPAVRAPDGSLIYLVDRHRAAPAIYDTDFAADGGPAAAANAAGITRIDHIALAVPDGQFDSWVLYFKSAFGFTADRTWVLPDPYGLVRSRAVRSKDGSVRIPLNISQSRSTETARALSTYSGAGVQHIACATNDIFACAAELKRRGLDMLAIPPNYYEDLGAKFGMAGDLIDRLAAANILYDREGDHEFFHFYSDTFDDRFCFEFVQRVSYDGYGAANAPVRMAARAQAEAGMRVAAAIL